MSNNMLYGSTATVLLETDKVVKTYFPSVSSLSRRIEVENLEILAEMQGLVRVPDLLSVGYCGDEIEYLILSRIEGLTLNELREAGLYETAELCLKIATRDCTNLGVHLPDLHTDGNIRVELKDAKVSRIWIVDTGDIF